MHTIIALFIFATMPLGSFVSPVANAIQCTAISAMHHEVKTFSETYEVHRGAQLTVENKNGDIEVRVWDEDVVDVQAEKKTTHGIDELQKVEIEVDTEEGIAVRTMYLEKDARVSVHYTIRVPEHVMVTQVETSNGSIELTDVNGDVEVTTSNGDVKAHGLDGKIDVATSNGSIELAGVANCGQAQTSNGSIEVEVLNSPRDDMHLVTSNGSIDLYVAHDVNAEVIMSTSLGKVSVHNVDISIENKSVTFVQGSLGAGGNTIHATTSNGSVELHEVP